MHAERSLYEPSDQASYHPRHDPGDHDCTAARVTQAFVLGAGFSMAVDYLRMPSTEQLGAEAIELLRRSTTAAP